MTKRQPSGLGPRTALEIAAPILLGTRLQQIREHEAKLPEGEAVHKMRVAARRLRAAIALVGDRAVRDLEPEVKALQDALGTVRDLQVQLSTLHEKEVEARLPQAQKRLEKAVRQWQKVAPRLEEAVAHCARPGRLGGGRVRRKLRRAIRKVQARIGGAVDAAADAKSAHRLRIAVKQLRYLAEVVEPALPHAVGAVLDAVKPLQEDLGTLHDLDVREEWLLELGKKPDARDKRQELAGALAGELQRWQSERLARGLRRQLD